MKKRLLLVFVAIMVMATAMSQTITDVAPSGQTLYYKIVNGEAHVVHPEGTPYPYYTASTHLYGDLEIPSSI